MLLKSILVTWLPGSSSRRTAMGHMAMQRLKDYATGFIFGGQKVASNDVEPRI